jgi:predicted DNA-binding protein with PD1-like motif
LSRRALVARLFATSKFIFFVFLSLFANISFAAINSNTQLHVLRLSPGDDPRAKLEAFVASKKIKAAVVVSAVGSLTEAKLRFANQKDPEVLRGHFEIVSLSGTLGAGSGSHLHMSISDEKGKTVGGHLAEGSKIYTTLEVAIAEITDIEFSRELDKKTGYQELETKSVSSP